jgi:predicted dehydrogenase
MRMRIDFRGSVSSEREVRAGFIGCGSHSFRNIYPVFQFVPVKLMAVCDLSVEKARAFAAQFGAPKAYSDYREMIAREDLEAVFIVTGYDRRGRPTYPSLTIDCLKAGLHVWIEKPPASSSKEIEAMQAASEESGKWVLVGLKKIFAPANRKARQLMHQEDFGTPLQVLLRYPQYLPRPEEFSEYEQGKSNRVAGFLDHLCHPTSLLVELMGMPDTLFYERGSKGSGVAVFRFANGRIASLAFTLGASLNGGMEHTTIISDSGRHISVENNTRLTLHRHRPQSYGESPDFYFGSSEETSAVWEPEFSLGQLYNKGLFLLGYYDEVMEFASSILEEREPRRGTLQQAHQITRIFEAFAGGPGKVISLS